MQDGYTQKEVLKVLDLNPASVQAWHKNGLMTASISDKGGRGKARKYSGADIVQLGIIQLLLQLTHNWDLVHSFTEFLGAEHSAKRLLLDPFHRAISHIEVFFKVSDGRWGQIQADMDASLKKEITMELSKTDESTLFINVSQIKRTIAKKLS